MDNTICDSDFENELQENTSKNLIMKGIGILLPCFAVFLMMVPTLFILIQGRKVSKRSRGKVRWQGIVTVVLTALVFCISYLPLAVYLIFKKFLEEGPSIHFKKVAFSLPMLNVLSNFYIYSLTVPSFRRFLSSKIKQTCNCSSGRSQIQDLELQQRGAQRPFPGVTSV
jgi:hypothetical protein